MPANLPPQYFEAEKRYREAKTPEGKIEALEEMLVIMPKHKGTDKLRAGLRRKISKFKSQSQQKKGTSKRETAYSIDRQENRWYGTDGSAPVARCHYRWHLAAGYPESGRGSPGKRCVYRTENRGQHRRD